MTKPQKPPHLTSSASLSEQLDERNLWLSAIARTIATGDREITDELAQAVAVAAVLVHQTLQQVSCCHLCEGCKEKALRSLARASELISEYPERNPE